MSAQLSRIGPGRGILVVLVCAVLALVGLTRSGLAGSNEPSADRRDPVVLAPPKVADPDLGGGSSGASARRTRTTSTRGAAKRERRKTCRTALGMKVRVPADFACPKPIQVQTPQGRTVERGGTGGAPAPAGQQNNRPRRPATTKTNTTPRKDTTTSPRTTTHPPAGTTNPTGGTPAGDE